jgi:hypothetical protein
MRDMPQNGLLKTATIIVGLATALLGIAGGAVSLYVRAELSPVLVELRDHTGPMCEDEHLSPIELGDFFVADVEFETWKTERDKAIQDKLELILTILSRNDHE